MAAPPRTPPLSPRKKPAQARSAETVRFILEAATRILETRGLEGFTTNAVAEKAGVSIGSLYQYFPNKEALTAALIEQETARLLNDAAEAARADSGRDGLRLLIRAAVGHQMRRPVLARLLDIQEARLLVDDRVDEVTRRLQGHVRDTLSRPNLPRQTRPETAAADVFALIKGMVDEAGRRGEEDAADLEQRVTRAVFGYLGLVLPEHERP